MRIEEEEMSRRRGHQRIVREDGTFYPSVYSIGVQPPLPYSDRVGFGAEYGFYWPWEWKDYLKDMIFGEDEDEDEDEETGFLGKYWWIIVIAAVPVVYVIHSKLKEKK